MMNRCQSHALHGSAGFTLVEALIVIGVLAILAGLTAPGLSGMVVKQQLKNAGFDIASTITLARSEALTRNVAVTVAPPDGNWAHGWTVTEAGGTLIRRQNGYQRIVLNGPANVIFTGEGRPNSTATPFAVTAGDANADSYRCVRIRTNGRPILAAGAC
jgi:type IV fimbrial biogenesis protein FimT